jgi:hypothetical protein
MPMPADEGAVPSMSRAAPKGRSAQAAGNAADVGGGHGIAVSTAATATRRPPPTHASKPGLTIRARTPWPFRWHLLAWVVGMTIVITRACVQAGRLGSPLLNFWVTVRLPGQVSVFACFFFAAATLFALATHAALSYEPDVRRLGLLATLFATFVTVLLGLLSANLTYPNMVLGATTEMATNVMLFTIFAECAEGGMGWVFAQIGMEIVFDIILGATSATFQITGDIVNSTAGAEGWTHALFYVYFALSAVLRVGVLHECQVRRASRPAERWLFRALIVFHVGLWLAFLALPTVLKNDGVDAALLFSAMVVIAVYILTPMLLVFFSALSHARARDVLLLVEQANRGRVAAEAASASRSEFLRCVLQSERGDSGGCAKRAQC